MSAPVLKGILLFALFIAASAIDIKKREIPDCINIMIALTGIIAFNLTNCAGIIIALPFLVTAMLCKDRMGGGDIKFMAAAGFTLGFEGALIAAIIGLTASLIYCAARYIIFRFMYQNRESGHDTAFPLAPFLSIGCITAFLLSK